MLSKVNSMALQGLDGYLIEVQVDVSNGMPCWEIVGLPDTSIKEAKERVRTAIKNSGYELLSKRIIINLAPADTKKEGSVFDLPIAIGILVNLGEIKSEKLEKTAFILPMCIEAKKLGIKKIIVPKENAEEAAIVNEIEVLGASNLKQVVDYLNNRENIKISKINLEEFFKEQEQYSLDFLEVKGQENIKRALEIAAAGGHNCLLIRKPGFAEKQ